MTEAQVLEQAKEALRHRNISFDEEKGLWPKFHELKAIRGGKIVPHWTIAYATPARVIEYEGDLHEVAEQYYFAVINDETGDFLYIITPTGYIE